MKDKEINKGIKGYPHFEIPLVYALKAKHTSLVQLIFQDLSDGEIVKMMNHKKKNGASVFSELFPSKIKNLVGVIEKVIEVVGDEYEHLIPLFDPFIKLPHQENIDEFEYIHPLLNFMIQNESKPLKRLKEQIDKIEIFDLVNMY